MSANLPLDIRPVAPSELPVLRQLAQDTFITAFGAANTPEDMANYVQANFSMENFQKMYQQAGVMFFLAWLDDQAVAYLKLNTGDAQSEKDLENALEIERIYVHAAYQGKGLGQSLLGFSVAHARQLRKKWIWLGVWDQNQGAIRFYERHGFRTFSQHDFFLGKDHQIDLLMKKKLA